MSKQSVSVPGSVSLFGDPVPYPSRVGRTTVLISVDTDSDGNSVVCHRCVEDEMKKLIPLNFDETKLSNLVEKGVDSHSLNIIDGNKMGVDAGVEALANHLINNSELYVNVPKDSNN